MASQSDRCAGVLLGLQVGDRNGGPIEMAELLAYSLIEQGCYNQAHVGGLYLGWWVADGAAVWDVGPTAQAVFERCKGDASSLPTVAAGYNLELRGMTAGANACHRVPPLALLARLSDEEVIEAASADALLTHASPLAVASSVAVALLCRRLVIGDSLSIAIAHVAAHPALEGEDASLIRNVLLSAPAPKEILDLGGFCVHALQAALHFALGADDFVSGLEDSIRFAGVSNYCPVICGAILGGRFGSRSIPRDWVASFTTTSSHASPEYMQLQARLRRLSQRFSHGWPGDSLHEHSSCLPATHVIAIATWESLDDMLQRFVLSYLHALNLVGRPAAASRAFSAACGHAGLCAHAYQRDLAPERELPTPRQPRRHRPELRQPRPQVRLSPEDLCQGDSGDAAKQLRHVASSLQGRSALQIVHLAADEGRPELLRWAALNGALMTNVDGEGRTALMVAAARNRPHTVLVATGCCAVSQQHERFGTALHMAAYVGSAAAVAQLCEAGADLEALNATYQQTPLLVACSRNHVEAARALLHAQADANVRDKDGLTPFRVARTMNSSEVLAVLQEHEERRQQQQR